MKKVVFIALAAGIFTTACNNSTSTNETQSTQVTTETPKEVDALMKKAQAYFKPLPEAHSFDTPKAKLGKKLYFETALSVNGKMSCNSCHLTENYGVDNEATSPGHENKRGDRNSPTVYNAYFHIAQFWDGRAADLAEQAKGPILNPVEMGIPNEETAVANIKAIVQYAELFQAAYPNDTDPITYNNIADAIGEFEQTLRTPAPFDAYLEGDASALNTEELAGLEVFINTGCITCHTGAGLGGHMYQKFGLVQGPYWEHTGSKLHDEGRFAITGKEFDKNVFKVPALRNVEKTAPYFHDGSVADLGEAVQIMAKTQLGKELTEQEIQSIVTFLHTLTGEIPAHALQNSEVAAL